MRWWGLAILAIGCGGKDDEGTDVGATDTEESETTDTVTCDVPTYDLSGMTCEQLGTAWANTVDAGNDCRVKEDCVILRAECEHWQNVTCWHAVNGSCVSSADLAEFNAEAANCFGQVCDCGQTPDVDCVNGRCEAI